MKNEEMALLFSEATPYIQKYHGKTMVIKYGGNAMINETLKNAVMNDLVTLTLLGVRVVLVHGGSLVALDLADLHLGDKGGLIVLIPQQAGDIGHGNQLLGLEGNGDLCGWCWCTAAARPSTRC